MYITPVYIRCADVQAAVGVGPHLVGSALGLGDVGAEGGDAQHAAARRHQAPPALRGCARVEHLRVAEGEGASKVRAGSGLMERLMN